MLRAINITRVINEEYAVKNSGKDIARLGSHALIITGKLSSKKNGSLMELEEVLQDTGTKYTVFDSVEENPSVETIMSARNLGISKGADFVIGLGGGSPMDAAKAVAIMLFFSDRGKEFLYEKPGELDRDENGNTLSYPVIAIPTTCGTGSEVTGVSVLTRNDLRTKKSLPHLVFPSLALLDPRYLMYAPQNILQDTAIDAMSHLIESYINVNATNESKAIVMKGLKLWSRGKDIIIGRRRVGYTKDEHIGNVSDYVRRVTDPDKMEADRVTDLKMLADMLTASNIAGDAIRITGTSLPHALSYRLTYELGVKHGPATAIFQPGFMSFADEKTRKELLRAMGFHDMNDFRSFLGEACHIGAVSEVDYGIVIENSIKDILADPARIRKVPYPVNREVLEQIASN